MAPGPLQSLEQSTRAPGHPPGWARGEGPGHVRVQGTAHVWQADAALSPQALSVGIFPYVLKLLQSSARELRPLLVFIWAKILAVDSVSSLCPPPRGASQATLLAEPQPSRQCRGRWERAGLLSPPTHSAQ